MRERAPNLLFYLRQPVDAASLVFFRIAFGAIMLWEVFRYAAPRGETGQSWIYRYYIQPDFHFKFYGFEWVAAWPGDGMYWHFGLLGVLSLCIILGLFYRLATVLFLFAFTYVFLLEQAHYLNHFYLVIVIAALMCLLPANRKLALDARLRPSIRSDTVPRWAVLALVAAFEIMLIYAGLVKVNHDWLRGQPLSLWFAKRAAIPGIGPWLASDWFVLVASYGVILLHLVGAPLLLWRKTRFAVFWAYALFHLANAVVFSIGIFPWFTIAGTLMFFDPDWPKQFGRWLKRPWRWPQARPVPAGAPQQQRLTGDAWLLALLAVFLLLQVLIPLRHWAYPGDVAWTEEGHRFAWRMKLRDKRGVATFTVRDPATGRTTRLNGLQYLNHRQVRKMTCRPDMILQFAHYLAERWRVDKGVPDAEVYARVYCSLNGRQMAPLIDSDRNLAEVQRNLWPADWILPLDKPLR